MSTHTGKQQKSQKWREGKLCPKCNKSKLTNCGISSHKNCALCKKCGASNF